MADSKRERYIEAWVGYLGFLIVTVMVFAVVFGLLLLAGVGVDEGTAALITIGGYISLLAYLDVKD
jgi:hypothetical protein